jgi:hypothetical protein
MHAFSLAKLEHAIQVRYNARLNRKRRRQQRHQQPQQYKKDVSTRRCEEESESDVVPATRKRTCTLQWTSLLAGESNYVSSFFPVNEKLSATALARYLNLSARG